MKRTTMNLVLLFCWCMLLLLVAGNSSAATYYVGPGRKYKAPSHVSSLVRDGDTVLIDACEYKGDVAAWYANDLTLKGVGGYAHLRADGKYKMGKGIWVIAGKNATVEWIEFSGAKVPDQNGAGIRHDGSDMTIRHCYFHDNETGILGGSGEILIEYTIFENNGYGDGHTHNLYIGNRTTKLTFQYCYSHHAKIGHNLKSRAQTNYILYNRIMDELDGTSSYAIDLPNGGNSYIIGNLIQQGPDTDNSNIISYGAEGLKYDDKGLYVVNNTIVNDRHTGNFVRVISGSSPVKLINNLFIGKGTILKGDGEEKNNLTLEGPAVVDITSFDYHLSDKSTAIDKGTSPGTANGFDLTPKFQYKHPASKEDRPVSGKIDVGAYEYINSAL